MLAVKPSAEKPLPSEKPLPYMPVPGENPQDENAALTKLELYWFDRLTFPTGRFEPGMGARGRSATRSDAKSVFPSGQHLKLEFSNPNALSTAGFTALGPQPERMTGCSGCFDYTLTEGRVNTIAIDPTTTTTAASLLTSERLAVEYGKRPTVAAPDHVDVMTDDPLIGTTAIDTVTIDPNDHNTVYAGTGDLNYGSFSMGSQGIFKSSDAGATWTVLGADVFTAPLPEPAGQFPQYNAVGKVRVDPNNSNNVVAGTKTGLYFSYDGGANWTGPCTTNSFQHSAPGYHWAGT